MNIFENYKETISKLLKELSDKGHLIIPDDLSIINLDIPPAKFDGDISSNVAMVIAKKNQKSPLDLAKIITKELVKEKNIEEVNIENPGFINIKFKKNFWSDFLIHIVKNYKTYALNEKYSKKKYLIEFVSANPTGPLHVGHCRGAILGDVLSNLLIFNNNKVTKEYYVNDFGGQIIHFTKSVYFRIREILYNEPFPKNVEDLYPGDYLINIAQNIINNNKKLKFDKFENIADELTKLAVSESIKLIKLNLKKLGIQHDNFASEREIVFKKEVDTVVNKLKKKDFVYIGKIKAPEGEDNS